MKLKKFISIALLCSVFGTFLFAQNSESSIAFEEESLVDSKLKKHYLGAALGMTLTNCVIGSWNRYVCKASWAQVELDDIKDPLKRPVEFDTDWYWTNFVLHPYQGGLYYLAARNSNLNIVESMICTYAGSLMWEYLFETNLPSVNDLVYSGLAGMIPGEILYRLGLEAQGRKNTFVSFVLNPERLLTDPLYGHKPAGPTNQLEEFSIKTGMGIAFANTWIGGPYSNKFEKFPFNAGLEVAALYADPYGHDSMTPYSQFYFEFGGAGGPGSGEGATDAEQKIMYDVHIFSDGALFSWAPKWGGENCDTTIGFVCEYDFVWNSFMEFSSVAPGFAIRQRFKKDSGTFEYQTHLAAEILGTTDCYQIRRDLYRVPSGVTYRDYMYTTGGELVQKFRYKMNNGLDFNWVIHGYAFYAYAKQRQEFIDDYGWSFFAFSDFSVEVPLNRWLSIGASDEFYVKRSSYATNLENYTSIWNNVNLYARFKF